MKSDQLLLAREVERTVYEYSSAWEGKQEQEIDLGEALLRIQPGFAAALARAAGCSIAVLQAQTRTSAPILVKRGFKPVCRIVGLAQRHDATK